MLLVTPELLLSLAPIVLMLGASASSTGPASTSFVVSLDRFPAERLRAIRWRVRADAVEDQRECRKVNEIDTAISV